jgi:DNA-binding beta-propeller fold protein YncE
MKHSTNFSRLLLLAGAGLLAVSAPAQLPTGDAGGGPVDHHNPLALVGEGPYKIVNSASYMGAGGIDYVTADSAGRKLYVPRGQAVLVFDLDTLKPVGSITNMRAHGVAVDVKSHHAFASSKPVAMWDTETLQLIKTIPVEGGPDGILADAASQHIFVLSHGAPNVTVLDARDGSIVGTIDLGGAPEQSQSDGQGHLYSDLEDKDSIAVSDLNTLKVTATYSLGGKGGGPAGLGLDAKNHILFAFCREPAVCVILNADDGKILDTLPIGNGTDGGGFNPNTMEAFSSQRDGTLTIIKENSPTSFAVEQNVTTKTGAKTCSLDTQKNQIVLIAVERTAAPAVKPATPPPATNAPAGERRGGRGANNGPGLLDILVVGQ